MEYIKRKIKKADVIRELLKENNAEAIILYNPKNRLWYTEFKSTEGYLLVTDKKSILYVDSRYITAAKKEAKNVNQIIEFGDVYDLINNYLDKAKIKNVAFESDFITHNTFTFMKKYFSNKNLVPINTNKIRAIKTNDEIKLIHKACEITDATFQEVLKFIKPGISEMEIDKIIYNSFIDKGAEDLSFPSIVVSGHRGDSPHGRASNKIINNNELVTIDFGCYYKGYSSDMTRTVAIGDKIKPELLKIYNIVKEAQNLGVKAVKPGITTKQIDAICREYITSKGYGKYFRHSTGHGLGTDVHEFPRLSPYCDVKLEPGMVVTVEPGIYIPKLGGVRIEDDILVTDNGYKELTTSPKELINIQN